MGKNKKNKWDIIIIGAGAAGMMAAVTAAREGKKVLILEQMDKLGKKIYATGNGKCNYTNANMSASCFNGDKAFISSVLERFTVEDCLTFFTEIGIYPKNRNGYFYPYSEQASSVVEAFQLELDRLDVQIQLGTRVTKINSDNYGIELYCETNEKQTMTYLASRIIIAVGLLAAPKLGSNGSLFSAIKDLGHRFHPILPALCGFYCKGIPFKSVAGIRAQGKVTAVIDGQVFAEDTGELQFVDYGISGIPVFQISSHLSKGLYKKGHVVIHMQLLPELTKDQLFIELQKRQTLFSNQPMQVFLNGLLQQKLSEMLLGMAGIDKMMPVNKLSDKQINRLIKLIQCIELTVEKYRDYEFAQVCTGGIPVTDIHTNTLESKAAKGIYFAGELLDVDGICGGYNLHFAWATGFIAGSSAAEE